MKDQPPHVTYLWLCTLKSRACFLLILEFIDLPRRWFKLILAILNKPIAAEDFFKHYKANSFQFTNHDMRTSPKL